MTYSPNFSDPRIRATAVKALNFVELYVRGTPWIARNELYKHFGDTSKPLGKYLKALLLTEADSYYNFQTGRCKRYQSNIAGRTKLKQLLGMTDFVPAISKELEQQVATGDFEYATKSNRLFNPIQFVPKEVRGSILNNHGYRYSYDIIAAAPSLILQRARQVNLDFQAPSLEHYIANRTQVRDQIAQDCGISSSDVKSIINSMLNGGVISRNPYSSILQQLNYNYDAIERLRANELIQNLRSDIREIWRTLKPLFPERFMTNRRGHQYRVRLTGRDKSGLYRELELQVGKVIQRYMKRKQVRCLWIHDGWSCDKVLDTNELCAEVRRQTGFVIELDWGIYDDLCS